MTLLWDIITEVLTLKQLYFLNYEPEFIMDFYGYLIANSMWQ